MQPSSSASSIGDSEGTCRQQQAKRDFHFQIVKTEDKPQYIEFNHRKSPERTSTAARDAPTNNGDRQIGDDFSLGKR
ncbi:hypothetical protein AAVH_37386 [Aphelenchoides avenae]|nr:hypothetical protein AAVH_37386 [Aphelenchus avenae]